MDRATFCSRMMPALRLCLKQGHIRNDAPTRERLGYGSDTAASQRFGTRLSSWVKYGVLLKVGSPGTFRRGVYRLTTKGIEAVETNARHAKRDTIAANLSRFLDANPDEELTVDDLMIKFECNRKQAQRAIAYLVQRGRAERHFVVRLPRLAPGQIRRAA